MANHYIYQRLKGIQEILIGVHQASSKESSQTTGNERERFIDSFLSQVMPEPFRFGSGDATDKNCNMSGQLDVVVEYPFLPSLPIVGAGSSRLYLAEGIAAVIEVKSNISTQWEEALRTARKLASLKRDFTMMFVAGRTPGPRIPLFIVGYEGWKKLDTVVEKLNEVGIDGILVIDPGIFVSSSEFNGLKAKGAWALWGLISCLHQATSNLKATSTNPLQYAIY